MFDDEKCCFVRKESVLLMMDRSLEEKKKKESIFVRPATPYHSSSCQALRLIGSQYFSRKVEKGNCLLFLSSSC